MVVVVVVVVVAVMVMLFFKNVFENDFFVSAAVLI